MRYLKIIFPFVFILTQLCIDVKAATYYSRQNGQYNAAATWSNTSHTGSAAGSPPCNCAPCSVSGSNALIIAHNLTIGCNLTYSGNPTVTVLSGASLSVTGNANVSGSVTLIVQAGATINISGNLNVNGGGGSVTVNGNLNIGGNLTINSSFLVCGTGNISVGGTITGTPCSTLTLPVTWLDISITEAKESVKVDWKTASEINNDYFTIQKSSDGKNFIPVGKMDGSGNSTSIKEYSFTDPNPFQGLMYYRISQTDYDGTTDVSKIFSILYEGDDSNVGIMLAPKGGGIINIIFNDLKNSKAEISIYDLRGNLINSELMLLSSQYEVAELKTAGLFPLNLCLITVKTENIFYSRKLLISN